MQLHITHAPWGEGNPYVQGATERWPHAPSSEDQVSLKLKTTPADSQAKVFARVKAGEAAAPCIHPGKWLSDEDSSSCWEIVIPPRYYKAGTTVSYTLHASRKGEEAFTQSFQYSVDGYYPLERVISAGINGETHYMSFTAGDRVFTRILDFSRPGQVKMHFSARKDSVPVVSAGDSNPLLTTYHIQDYSVHLSPKGICLNKGNKGNKKNKGKGTPIYAEKGLEIRMDSGGQALGLRAKIACARDEKFFGFGERFNALNQKGKTLDVRVYEEYKRQDKGQRTYFPVPFFLSSACRAHWVNSSRRVSYDLRGETFWIFEAELGPEKELETILFTGPPRVILRAFAQTTGYPVLPPPWVFEPWMSSNEWNSQERVMKELQTTRELDIPAGVLVIEAWSDEKNFYIWNDAEYEPVGGNQFFSYDDFSFPASGLWPDPRQMIQHIHDQGLKLILWQIPVHKKQEETNIQHERDRRYMADKMYCVREKDGSPYAVRPPWFKGGYVIDFTNPEAKAWWLKKREYLIRDLGVDGFKTDGGEHLWGLDLRYSDGRTNQDLWNLYPVYYLKAYSDFIRQSCNGVVFSRSGFTGCQKYPVHWAGDQDSTWEAHRSVLRAVLSSGVSGIPFVGWDIGGFSGAIPSAELYVRSTAMACFGSIMQYHSEFNNHRNPHVDRTPWNIARRTGYPEVVDIYRFFAKLRMNLLPYIQKEAAHCAESGEPLMRPLFLDYPEDDRTWDIEDQYLFGRNLLVAPLLYEGEETRRVYLPEGMWVDFFTEETHRGARSLEAHAPWNRIPVYRQKDISWDIPIPYEGDRRHG